MSERQTPVEHAPTKHSEHQAIDPVLADLARDLQRAQQAGRIGSLSVDYASGLWSTSPVGCEVLGLDAPRPRTTGEFMRLVMTEDRAPLLKKLRNVTAEGGRLVSEFRIVRPTDGALRWIRTIGETDFDDTGKPWRRVGTLMDITDQKLAEQALQKSEAHYRTLVEASPEAIRVICDGRIVMANPAALKLLGASAPDQLLGRDVIETMHPDYREEARERMRIVVDEQRAVMRAEQCVLRADGSEVWIDVKSMPYTYEGKPAVLSIARDLSELRAAEVAHREISLQLAGIIDSAMDAIVSVDVNLKVVVFNQAAERMFRIQAAQAIGMHIDVLIPARFQAAHARWMLAFAVSGKSSRTMGNPAHLAARRADGEEFRAEASISHSEVAGRRVYTVIMRDVTGPVAAQKKLVEAETRYRSLAENSTGGVVILAGDIIEYANPGLASILGHANAAALMGTSIFDTLSPAFHERVRANLAALGARAGVTLAPGRLHMQRRDGNIIDVEATATSFETGGRIVVQSEIRDITRKLRALREVKAVNRTLEARIAARTADLTRANRELEAFSYSVAHDLRAPLRSMSGFAQLLQIDVDSGALDNLPQHVSRITANAQRMGQLIDGLLAVARASHGELSSQRVDMDAMLESVLVEHGARERAQTVVDHMPAVIADAAAMRQVWDNLISNALKYSGHRTAAKIRVKCGAGASEMTFSDNGAGFEPARAERLFGVFQRLHPATEFEGTGVGLAIVRQVVERHGGRAWAEGAPDQGATFHFSLPKSRLAPAQGTPPAPASGG